jgi:hypothetical protein
MQESIFFVIAMSGNPNYFKTQKTIKIQSKPYIIFAFLISLVTFLFAQESDYKKTLKN